VRFKSSAIDQLTGVTFWRAVTSRNTLVRRNSLAAHQIEPTSLVKRRLVARSPGAAIPSRLPGQFVKFGTIGPHNSEKVPFLSIPSRRPKRRQRPRRKVSKEEPSKAEREQIEDDGGAGNAPVGVWLKWIAIAICFVLVISVGAYLAWEVLGRAPSTRPTGSRSARSAERRDERKSRKLRQQTKHKCDEGFRRGHLAGYRMRRRSAERRDERKSGKPCQ
jgi:hypothetical protein